jgi:hypothetical protein
MPYNLFLLPLLGGFVLARRWNLTRFYALRAESYVTLLYASLAGAVLLLIARALLLAITSLLDLSPTGTHFVAIFDREWHNAVPFRFSGVASLAFILGVTLWWPLNRIPRFEEKLIIKRIISLYGDPFVQLSEKALYRGKLLLVTLKSEKVYVGFVTYTVFTTHPGFPIRCIRILPFVSGYRDDKKRVEFTTFYEEATASAKNHEDEALPNLTEEDFEITIPIDDIVSATLFSPKVYYKHFRHKDAIATTG